MDVDDYSLLLDYPLAGILMPLLHYPLLHHPLSHHPYQSHQKLANNSGRGNDTMQMYHYLQGMH